MARCCGSGEPQLQSARCAAAAPGFREGVLQARRKGSVANLDQLNQERNAIYLHMEIMDVCGCLMVFYVLLCVVHQFRHILMFYESLNES